MRTPTPTPTPTAVLLLPVDAAATFGPFPDTEVNRRCWFIHLEVINQLESFYN